MWGGDEGMKEGKQRVTIRVEEGNPHPHLTYGFSIPLPL